MWQILLVLARLRGKEIFGGKAISEGDCTLAEDSSKYLSGSLLKLCFFYFHHPKAEASHGFLI
jgi:hypothetical protein